MQTLLKADSVTFTFKVMRVDYIFFFFLSLCAFVLENFGKVKASLSLSELSSLPGCIPINISLVL